MFLHPSRRIMPPPHSPGTPPHAPSTCVICGALRRPDASPPLCGSVPCRWRYDAVPEAERCIVCRRPLEPAEFALHVCAAPDCRQRAMVKRPLVDRLEQERRRRLFDETMTTLTQQRREEQALRDGVDDPAAYAVVLVPALRRAQVPVTVERRALLRAHLVAEVAAALQPESDEARARRASAEPEEPSPDFSAVIAGACSRCEGFCCRNAAEHAYLRVDTMRAQFERHPELDPDTLVERYLSYAGPSGTDGSCIFHGSRGCSLPRDMRAPLCRRFICGGLKLYHNDHRAVDGGRAFVVAADAETVHASGFVDVRELRVRRSAQREGRQAAESPRLPAHGS